MLNSKQNRQQIILCTKFFLYRFFKHPLGVFFIVIFPIAGMIASYFIGSYNEHIIYNGVNCPAITISVAGPLFLSIISLSLLMFPIGVSLDRIHRRLKIYKSFGLDRKGYVLANIFSLFLIFLPVFIVQILILNFALGAFISAGFFFLIFFIGILSFLVASTIGFFIGTLPKTDKYTYVITMLFFYPVLLFSGVSIPSFTFDHHQIGLDKRFIGAGLNQHVGYSWFKFIQFLSPIGTGIYFIQNAVIGDKSGVNLFSWDVDGIGIVLQLAFAGFCYIFSIKRFKGS